MRRPEAARRLGVLAQDHERRRRAARQRVDEVAEPLLLARDLGGLTEKTDDHTVDGAESGARLGPELSDVERRRTGCGGPSRRQRRHTVTRARQPRGGVVPHEVEPGELAVDRVRVAGVVLQREGGYAARAREQRFVETDTERRDADDDDVGLESR